MERFEVVQRLLDLFPSPRYLEIGVNEGHTFHKLNAATKVGVDPDYLFDLEAARTAHPGNRYEVETSDAFFARGATGVFDVVFVDGLHVFEQVLRDFNNSASVLSDNGIIVVDDVIPRDFISSLPNLDSMYRMRRALGSADATWMGDVYKLIFHIAAFAPAFSYATVAENHGQAVCWRQPRMPVEASIKQIADLDFSAVTLRREVFNILPFEEIMTSLRGDR